MEFLKDFRLTPFILLVILLGLSGVYFAVYAIVENDLNNEWFLWTLAGASVFGAIGIYIAERVIKMVCYKQRQIFITETVIILFILLTFFIARIL